MEIELRGIQEELLDVVDRRRTAGKIGGQHPILAYLLLQPFKLAVAGSQFRMFEQTGHDVVILPFPDGVLGYPGDRDAGLLHLLAVHRDGPHDPPGGMVFDRRAPATLALHADLDLRRKGDADHLLPQGENPQRPVEHRVRIGLVGKIGDRLVQRPPFGTADLIGTPPLVPLRQGMGEDIGVVPEIQTRDVGETVGHLAPDRHEDSFFVCHREKPPCPSSPSLATANAGPAIRGNNRSVYRKMAAQPMIRFDFLILRHNRFALLLAVAAARMKDAS